MMKYRWLCTILALAALAGMPRFAPAKEKENEVALAAVRIRVTADNFVSLNFDFDNGGAPTHISLLLSLIHI